MVHRSSNRKRNEWAVSLLAAALERAGFSRVRLETLGLSPAVVSAIGVNEAEA